MELIATAIAGVWMVLFGGAYLCRTFIGLGRQSSVLIVTLAYGALAAVGLMWLGPDREGVLGALGMLLPYTAAIGLIWLLPGKSTRMR